MHYAAIVAMSVEFFILRYKLMMKMNVVFLHYAKNTLFHLKYVQQKILNTPKRQCTDFENHRNDIIAKNCVIILAKIKSDNFLLFVQISLRRLRHQVLSRQRSLAKQSLGLIHSLLHFYPLARSKRKAPFKYFTMPRGKYLELF